MDESHLDNSSKQFRRRKKHLHKLILTQMEFYFGDSNLSKDRHLSDLIKKDPYVELKEFLKFNKIKALTKKTEDLVSAIKKSEILELSDDGLKVRRTTPIRVRDDVDKCTIYVERIPVDFTHDSLNKIFSEFGKVEYVSIPKYKDNQLMKGFAFVEFDTPESANKTLEHFASIGCRLPSQMPPEKLLSVTTFQIEQKRVKQNTTAETTDSSQSDQTKEGLDDGGSQENNEEPATEKKVNKRSLENPESDVEKEELKKSKLSSENSETGDSSDVLKTIESDKQKNKESRKRKISSDNQECETKKNKQSAGNQESSTEGDELKSPCAENKEPRKRKRSMDQKSVEKKAKTGSVSGDSESGKLDETADENEPKNTAEIESEEEKYEEESNDENESVKRKRKRKKSQKRAVLDIKELGLQVLPKCEWKRLRNKYLDLQRSQMKSLKQQLNRARYNSAQYLQNFNSSKSSVSSSTASGDSKTDTENVKKKIKFVPGSVIHLQLPEPCTDVKMLKNEIKSYSTDIQYIDVTEGQFEACVRFATRLGAAQFTKCPFAATMSILTGDAEQQYWAKIQKDREEKFKKGKTKQRGRDKLLKKSERELSKHIRFEDTD